MRVVTLDARAWTTLDDLFDAVLPALGAPEWHGRSLDALAESMAAGGINAQQPPYRLSLTGVSSLRNPVRKAIRQLIDAVNDEAVAEGLDVRIVTDAPLD